MLFSRGFRITKVGSFYVYFHDPYSVTPSYFLLQDFSNGTLEFVAYGSEKNRLQLIYEDITK